MSFLQVHLVGECEEEMARLHVMADKIDPMAVAAGLDQKEKIIVLSMGQVQVGAMSNLGVVDLLDLEKVVPVLAGLPKGIIWDILFLSKLVQMKNN